MKYEIWDYERKIYDDEDEVGLGYESEIVAEVTFKSTHHPADPVDEWWEWDHELQGIKPISVRPCLQDVPYDEAKPINFADLPEHQAKKVKELCDRKKEELTDDFLVHSP